MLKPHINAMLQLITSIFHLNLVHPFIIHFLTDISVLSSHLCLDAANGLQPSYTILVSPLLEENWS